MKNKQVINPLKAQLWLIGLMFFFSQACAYSLRYNLVKASRTIDGDTIKLNNLGKVRYLCINTPEIHHSQKPPEPYGEQAWIKNIQLLVSEWVVLEFDLSRRDRYGRLLALVYSSSGLVNAQLLKNGYATLMVIPPNQSCQACFIPLEKNARDQHLGIWK